MAQNLGYLFAAFAATWVAFFAYLFFVQRTLSATSRRLRWLEEDAEADPSAGQAPEDRDRAARSE